MRLRVLFVAAPLLAACATAAGPRVANNPCEDAQYRAPQPVDSLSEREYRQLQEDDAACQRVTALLAAAADAPRRPEVRLDTEAYTQAMQNELGSEIFIRNTSNVPILVTSVTLTSCVGIREPRARVPRAAAPARGRARACPAPRGDLVRPPARASTFQARDSRCGRAKRCTAPGAPG